MDDKVAQQVLTALGNIQGELKGLREIVQSNHSAMNQRINDIAAANEKRLDSLEDRVSTVENNQTTLLMKTATGGGLAGGAIALAIEFLKIKGGS